MCHYASKKGLNEGFWVPLLPLDTNRCRNTVYDDFYKILEFYHLSILSIGDLKFEIEIKIWNFKKHDDNLEKISSFVTITQMCIFLNIITDGHKLKCLHTVLHTIHYFDFLNVDVLDLVHDKRFYMHECKALLNGKSLGNLQMDSSF